MSITVVMVEEYQALVARVEELEKRLAAPPPQPEYLDLRTAVGHLGCPPGRAAYGGEG